MRLITLAALAATLLGAVPSQAANDTTKNAPGSSPPVSTQTPTVTVTTPANDDSAASQATPQVFYGDADLPAPVKELRQKLLTAIKTGELESLRPIFAANGGNPDLPGGESDDPIATLTLECYPDLAIAQVEALGAEAVVRFGLIKYTVIHRYGRLRPGEPIVQVMTLAPHREAAFKGAEFLMDFLKTDAPFWKKEATPAGERWVEAKTDDDAAKARWE